MDARATALPASPARARQALGAPGAPWRRGAGRPPTGEPAEASERMNLGGIDFVSLRLVVLCAELGSLSCAAKQANMSLSCASHRISTAEDLFGARLFERDHRGLHPTHAGAVFVTHARAILNILRRALRQVRPPATPTGAGQAPRPPQAWHHGA